MMQACFLVTLAMLTVGVESATISLTQHNDSTCTSPAAADTATYTWTTGTCLTHPQGDTGFPWINEPDTPSIVVESLRFTCASAVGDGNTTVEYFSDDSCAQPVDGASTDATIRAGIEAGLANPDAWFAMCVDVEVGAYTGMTSGLPMSSCIAKVGMTPTQACVTNPNLLTSDWSPVTVATSWSIATTGCGVSASPPAPPSVAAVAASGAAQAVPVVVAGTTMGLAMF